MRPVGEAFMSIGHETRRGVDWTALYAEYGWSDHATIILDAGVAEEERERIALLSLRTPLPEWGGQKLALTFGAGAGKAKGDFMAHPVVQVALNWGKGFGNGWTTVDLTARETPYYNGAARKVDITVGYNPWASSSIIGQAQYEDARDKDEQTRISVGWVQHFGPVAAVVEAGKRLRQNREPDVKLSLWLKF